jgi:predicted ATPase
VTHQAPGYALVLAHDEVDAWKFEELVAAAREASPENALDLLDEALTLWRGPAFAEFADEPFARGEAIHLEELRRTAELDRLDALLALGEHERAVAEAVRLTDEDPLREGPWERRMRALHASGATVDAIRVFHEYRRTLADETGLDPSPELAALERALLSNTPVDPHRSAAPAAPAIVPSPLTPLIGRAEDLASALELLTAGERVITLTGPPGVGKTRLAIDLARASRATSGYPVWFTDLTSLPGGADDAVIAGHLARTLGLSDADHPADALRRALGDVGALLVLDNCEHVVAGVAATVERLVPLCPGLQILATGLSRLGVPGERTLRLDGLAVPDAAEVGTIAELVGHPATRLFVEQAERHGVALADRPETVAAVTAVCSAVDGLPLGIELAAALVRALPVARIADGLSDRQGQAPPAPGRHRSLDAALSWGHELMTMDEQMLLRRLSVFRGGWTLDAAERVCPTDDLAPSAVAGLLARLVDASFTVFDPATGRYSMLEPVSRFARARLVDAGEESAVADRHLVWCQGMVDELEAHIVAGTADLEAIAPDYPNVRAALGRAVSDSHDPAGATRLVDRLYVFWQQIGTVREAVDWMNAVLDVDAPLTAERVRVTRRAGNLSDYLGHLDQAIRRWEQSLAMARELGDDRQLAWATLAGGRAAEYRDRPGLSEERAAEARRMAERLGDPALAAEAASQLAILAGNAGRYADACSLIETSLAATDLDPWHEQGSRHVLANLLWERGLYATARAEAERVERDTLAAGDPLMAKLACTTLAVIELSAGDHDAANAAWERARSLPGVDEIPVVAAWYDAVGALVTSRSGDPTVNDEGRLPPPPDPESREHDHLYHYATSVIGGVVCLDRGDDVGARRCFSAYLSQPAGRRPRLRADALHGLATVLHHGTHKALAADVGAVAEAIRERHGLALHAWMPLLPPRLRIAGTVAPSPVLDEEEAIALALAAVGHS